MRIHAEIIDFCDFLSPTPEEQASRNAAVESVVEVIKHIWPKAKVCLILCICKTSLILSCTRLWDYKLMSCVKLLVDIVLQAEVFGSFKTGLYLPSSDVDVSLLLIIFLFFEQWTSRTILFGIFCRMSIFNLGSYRSMVEDVEDLLL